MATVLKLLNGLAKRLDVDEVKCHVQFLETLAASDALNFPDGVDRQVKVLQFLQLRQALHFLNEVVLEVQDFEVATVNVEARDDLNILLVQTDFFEGR